MPNDEKEMLKDTFPSNSKTIKKEPVKKDIKKVVTGKVKKKKKTFSKKMAETFLEDDTKSVSNYIIHDVIIPAAKGMISDMVGGGIEMLLFGERRGGRTTRDRGRSYVNYNSVSYRNDRDSKRDKVISRSARARHDFDEIELETRGEAEEVLSHLVDLTIDYGMASVADLYELVGVESSFTDNKYGWTDLAGAYVGRVRTGGYILNLPRTQPLD